MDASSYDAYQRLVAQGLLGIRQRQVVATLMQGGPQTGRELNARMGIPDAHKRLSELERKGIIESNREAVCNVSHRKSKVWQVCWQKIPSYPVMNISTDPERKLNKAGIRQVLDVKTGPTIYAAIVDGMVLMASSSQHKILEYCKASGVPMMKFRPERVWHFHNPNTSGKVFQDRELFPNHEGV